MKTNNMLKIGVLSEHPVNDSKAFCMLLDKRNYPNTQFVIPITNIYGDQVEENPKALGKRLNGRIAQEQLKYLICVRDLDTTVHNEGQIKKRENWFNQINTQIDNKGILFLAVVKMEALLLADIDRINEYFKIKLSKYSDPKFILDPKKELENKTTPSTKANKEYKEHLVCDIIEKIDFEAIYQNHKGERSFQEFIDMLDTILKFRKGKK